MIKGYIWKLFHSFLLPLSAVGVLLSCCVRFLGTMFYGEDAVSEIQILMDIDSFRKTIVIFSALPFSANFAMEWKHGITNSCIMRSSLNRYAFANVIVCFFSAVITAFVGMLLYVGIECIRLPLYLPSPNSVPPPFGVFITSGHPLIYMIIKLFLFSVSCGAWAISGLLLSVFFPDGFVAVCTPFFMSFLLERISMQLPDVINLWHLSCGRVSIGDSAALSFIYPLLIFLSLTVYQGLLFAKCLKRRAEHALL